MPVNPLLPMYEWSEKAGRYVNVSTRKFVKFSDVRDALDVAAERSQANMGGLSTQLQNGEISLEQWRSGMRREIKTLHTASAMSAKGGPAQMTQADWGAVGRITRFQYDKLNKFASEIESGKQPLNGRFLRRVGLYAQAGRGTFEQMRRRDMLKRGWEEERRVLGRADHCAGCLEQAGMGWQPPGKLAPIGSQQCVTNCHCRYAYRKRGSNGWIVFEG